MDGKDPRSEDPSNRDRPGDPIEWGRWALRTDQPAVRFVREVATTVLVVALVGVALFAISGVWPPLVAVESGSMEPHMFRGDLVFIVEEDRFGSRLAVADTGVVTAAAADHTGYTKFGGPGDVIVFRPNGAAATPIIHRARFWVDEGENWYPRADPAALPPGSDGCAAIANCPAPHAGFITKGDANRYYDQVSGISGPVKPAWVRGTAEVRIPWLGYVRLCASDPGVRCLSGTPLATPASLVLEPGLHQRLALLDVDQPRIR